MLQPTVAAEHIEAASPVGSGDRSASTDQALFQGKKTAQNRSTANKESPLLRINGFRV